jgi:DnaJ-class molecular chaperone
MDFQSALDELEITLDTEIDIIFLKKRYHKLALKYHPDKNKDESSKNKFQRINDAYYYLLNIFEEPNSNAYDNVDKSDNFDYVSLLTTFITTLFNQDIMTTILKDIVSNYENITLNFLTNKFEQLDKQKSTELFLLLIKYKDIFHINSETLQFVSSIFSEKYKNDRLFILYPQINDILNHNIYKLQYDNQLYLVPLWHNEIYFDSPNKEYDVIVLCQPSLPTNTHIDENNNIYTEIYISIKNDLINLLNANFVSLSLGEKKFFIPLNKLCIKEQQFYRIKGEGIARISDNNMYDVATKSDIIVKIILTE